MLTKGEINACPHRYRALFVAQRGRCYLCGRPMSCPEHITSDHVVPKCKMRKGTHDNRALAHKKCNMTKASRLPRACERFYVVVLYETVDYRWNNLPPARRR